MPSVVGLIPARSGSKRVVDKNVRKLGAHPMMAYTISAALQSKVFDRVIVSTDSAKYADIAQHYGAEVPCQRPVDLATSTSPDVEWVSHMLAYLKSEGQEYDCFAILRPTSPFRSVDTIRRAWTEFCAEEGIDSLRAVEKVVQHPGKMWIVRGKRMLPLMPLSPAEQPWYSTQMAALPEVWVQNASLEIAWTRLISSGGNIAGVVLMPFFTNHIESFDINNQYDWNLCEAMLSCGDAHLPQMTVAPYKGASLVIE